MTLEREADERAGGQQPRPGLALPAQDLRARDREVLPGPILFALADPGLEIAEDPGAGPEPLDPGARAATIRIFSRVTWHVPRLVATILGGVAVDAGGWMILNGKIHKIPPRGPVTRILEQAMLYQSSQLELAAQSTRDQVRRGALDAIASELESLREEVAPFRSPPPIQERGQA